MPRRRMIDPSIWEDAWFGDLSFLEQIFFIGIISNADDDGRILATPAFLRSRIFIYKDISLDEIQKMIDKFSETNKNFVYYSIGGLSYAWLKKWGQYQKPKYPTPSKLPPPPKELVGESLEESFPPQSSLGKSSLGKYSIGKLEFTEFLNNENDLTNRLTTTLTEYMPRGRVQAMEVVKHLWEQSGKNLNSETFQIIYTLLDKYPIPTIAKSLVKAVKYSGGKRNPSNYIKAIFNEQSGGEEKKTSGKAG